MTMLPLSALDLALASLGVLAVAALTWRLRLGLAGGLLLAALRTVVQLLLVGLVLRALFAHATFVWVALLSVAMLLIAGREVRARQKRRLGGLRGYGIGTISMFVSSFVVTILALVVIIGPDPWFAPRYAIPLLGMVLGNTMTGVAVALDRLLQGAWDKRSVIEQRLILGEDGASAIWDVARDSIRSGLIPIMNSMAAAGIVSLPGMMTGQILAGSSPLEAVRYQILIMFLIAGGTGLGTLCAVWLAARRLFDTRHRLRLDRLELAAGRRVR
jgi:putative ABC transport system permease protein